MFDERFRQAASRVLDGDESMHAANALEQVLIEDYPGDERFDDLHEALALYSPFDLPPYVQASALREQVSRAMRLLDAGSQPQG